MERRRVVHLAFCGTYLSAHFRFAFASSECIPSNCRPVHTTLLKLVPVDHRLKQIRTTPHKSSAISTICTQNCVANRRNRKCYITSLAFFPCCMTRTSFFITLCSLLPTCVPTMSYRNPAKAVELTEVVGLRCSTLLFLVVACNKQNALVHVMTMSRYPQHNYIP